MLQPDERLLAAIARLKNDEDFQLFEQWLKDSQTDEYRYMAGMEANVELRWSQGKAQNLGAIIEQIYTVDDDLKLIQRSVVRPGANQS